MGSTFKGQDLFGSGPHVFEVWRQGRRVLPLSLITGDPFQSGSIELSDYEPRVTVKGTLVASSESGLQSLRDNIAAEAAFGSGEGDLVDHHGQEYEDVYLYWVQWAGAVNRGREWSIGYEALFGVIS